MRSGSAAHRAVIPAESGIHVPAPRLSLAALVECGGSKLAVPPSTAHDAEPGYCLVSRMKSPNGSRSCAQKIVSPAFCAWLRLFVLKTPARTALGTV